MTYYNVPTLWTSLEVHTDLQAGPLSGRRYQ